MPLQGIGSVLNKMMLFSFRGKTFLSFFLINFLSVQVLQAKAPESYRPKILEAIESLENASLEKPKKLLIFSKTNGYRHKSIPVGQLALALMGEKTHAYEAVVSDDLSYFEPDIIKEFSAICFFNTTGAVFAPTKTKDPKKAKRRKKNTKQADIVVQEDVAREERLKQSFIQFIERGGGFVGIHAATDTYSDWDEFVAMIGAAFDGHPWRSSDEVQIKVVEGAEDHVLVKHLEGENLIFKEEIYQYKESKIKTNAEVLLRLDPHRNVFSKSNQTKEKFIPISWTKSYGEGRVFYCSLGHNEFLYHDAKVLQHYLSGIQWALGDL